MARSERADEYFNRSFEVVAGTPLEAMPVCYAVFTRTPGLLCGVTDVLGLINQHCEQVTVRTRLDGYAFRAGEVVMTIEGPFGRLVTLETEYLGMLALSKAAANMSAIVDAAGDAVQVIDMAARHYPPEIGEYVAVAAAVGGAVGTSTPLGHKGVFERYGISEDRIQIPEKPSAPFALYGSIPHALNAVHGGSSIETATAYHARFPDAPLTVLLDFEGRERDVVAQAVERFGSSLYAVRLDTPGNRVCQGCHEGPVRALEMRILSQVGNRAEALAALERYGYGCGVTIEAAYAIRDLLDSLNARSTRLVLSSGFDLDKVRAFRACKAPMDVIGTGSWVEFAAFTSDIVRVFENGEWVPRCKAGRREELIEPEDLPVVLSKGA